MFNYSFSIKEQNKTPKKISSTEKTKKKAKLNCRRKLEERLELKSLGLLEYGS